MKGLQVYHSQQKVKMIQKIIITRNILRKINLKLIFLQMWIIKMLIKWVLVKIISKDLLQFKIKIKIKWVFKELILNI